MKNTITRMWKSTLALCLALCLVIGLCPAAFATVYTAENFEKQADALNTLLQENYEEVLENARKYHADQGYAKEFYDIVADLEEKLEVASANYAEETKAAIKAAVEELEAKADATAAKVEELKAVLADNKAKLEAAIEAADAEAEDVIAELEATIAILEADIAVVEAELIRVKAVIENLLALVEDMEAALVDLSAAVVEMNAAVENVGAVLENGVVTTVEAAAEVVDAAVATAKAAVAVVETAVERVQVLGEEATELAVDAYEQFYALGEQVVTDLVAEAIALRETEAYKLAVEAILAEAAVHEAAIRAEVDPIIEAKGHELEAMNAELADYLKDPETQAHIQEKVAALQTELAALNADLEAKIAEIDAAAQAQIEALNAAVEAQLAAVEAAVNEAIAAVEALNAAVEADIAATAAEIEALVEAAIDAFKAAYINATTGKYVPADDSLYVAIGDDSAVADSYVGVLEEMIKVNTINLAKKGLAVEDAFAVVEKNAETIAKADLITLGFNNTAFIGKAIDAATVGAELDWASVVGAEAAAKIEEVIAANEPDLAELIGDEATAAMISSAIEAYAYSCVSYACKLPELVNAVRAINGDAVVVIVGMYNPLAGISIDVEGTVLNVGDYLDVLVAAAGVHNTAYAMLTANGIAVAAPNAETQYAADGGAAVVDAVDLGLALVRYADDFLPSEAGDIYIAEKIADALGLNARGILMGDVNLDGVVNAKDAMLVLQYYVKKITETDLYLPAADVDGNDAYNAKDAMLILQKYVKIIDKFPVEN